VLPTFIEKDQALGLTHNEYNGVLIGSSLADEQFFYGKGAGRYPTSSAVLSDISAYKYNYKYEYKKGHNEINFKNRNGCRIYLSSENGKAQGTDVFSSIEERYEGINRTYTIGHASFRKLETILNRKDISVISFN
jgi:homoserine dehydrogenase